jgi:hypothetical protein
VKHAIGAVVTPAPICPTPASLVRDAAVDHRQHAAVDDLARVDAGRGRAKSSAGSVNAGSPRA